MEYPKKLEDLKARCFRITFQKDDYCIAIFMSEDDSDTPQIPKGKSFSMKGSFMASEGEPVLVSGNLDTKNVKYQGTYFASGVRHDIDFSDASDDDVLEYLSFLTSVNISENMFEMYGRDIIEVLDNSDTDKLMEVHGVGEATAKSILEKHSAQKDYSDAFLALCKPYGMTEVAVRKVVDYYNSDTQLTIKKITENPYCIVEVPGWGFKKADEMFLRFHKYHPDAYRDTRRVDAYIEFLFEEEYGQGNTWVTPKQLMNKVMEFIPKANMKYVVKHVNDSRKFLTIPTSTDIRITTRDFFEEEFEIAKLLIERVDNDLFKYNAQEVEEILKEVEEEQGFEYDEGQREAIDRMIESGVFLLQGLAGSGKSSIIKGVVRVLEHNHLSIAQSALSGRAANNLQQITGREGSTIHRLLRIGSPSYFNENNRLPYDVVIVDEISMVSNDIFLKLLKAMRDDAKLIMVGDLGQLPSIGVGPANGIIHSQIVPNAELKKIHRQAQKSAIVTHSIYARHGKKPDELKYIEGREAYGENNDMEYHFIPQDEEGDIINHSMSHYIELIKKYGVDDVSLLASTRANVFRLNQVAQLYANPKSDNKEEFEIISGDEEYTLRVGDRVMNFRNNYDTVNHEGMTVPIFNGNTGTIRAIEERLVGEGKRAKNKLVAVIDFDGVDRILYELDERDNSIQLGYAYTVHKSQGSTLKSVVIAFPFQYMLNSREWLYTAITRASDYCVLVTSPKTLRSAYKKSISREQQTNLQLIINNFDEINKANSK